MLKRTTFIFAIVGLLIAGTAKADDNRHEKQKIKTEIKQDQKEIVVTQSTLRELSHIIDLWHDANLKGDNKRIRKYHDQLTDVLMSDVRSTSDMVSRYEREAYSPVRKFNHNQRKWSERIDDRHAIKDDRDDFNRARKTLKVKQRLMASFIKSPTFSGKYRLLGDYVEIVRNELGMTRVELVEDVEEFRKD